MLVLIGAQAEAGWSQPPAKWERTIHCDRLAR